MRATEWEAVIGQKVSFDVKWQLVLVLPLMKYMGIKWKEQTIWTVNEIPVDDTKKKNYRKKT